MTGTAWIPIAMMVGGYLLGSVPFGIVVSRCLGSVDPRTAGSRNIGFTNVLRVSGKKAGFLTLAGDLGKGWLAGWLATQCIDDTWWPWLIALSPIVGHLSSIFLGFRGGKGVATALGVILGVAPWIGLTVVLVWLATAAMWRYSSGAAITAFLSLPLVALAWRGDHRLIGFTLLVSALILWRHTDNMIRLWKGTEPKIGRRKEPTA
ncbi:MAG TPA: glycerol-3-phosphate 1-O-acyltransferase PlsY [Nitrospiraceae bacterium]|nr:glycerol-3-phosphate 1-O-acyltransferase PlsY [Nitrospiraceae bacterium]